MNERSAGKRERFAGKMNAFTAANNPQRRPNQSKLPANLSEFRSKGILRGRLAGKRCQPGPPAGPPLAASREQSTAASQHL